MSTHNKQVKVGRGVDVIVSKNPITRETEEYISINISKDESCVMIRGNGKVLAFNSWSNFVNALDVKNAVYFSQDK